MSKHATGRTGPASLPAVGLLVVTASLLALPVLTATGLADEVEPESGPASSPARATVEAELAGDGDIVGASVRHHARDAATGRVTEHLDDLDPRRIPIAVRIRYELDGRQVAPGQLEGATGQAAVRLQLRNLTDTARAVTRPGGDELERDLSLPLVVDGLLELDDSWYDVHTDVGRLAPARDGATQLRWSTALFEPFGQTTTQIEVRGQVEGASLPRLEVDARPVTAETSDLLQVLERRATGAGTADAVATFIADNLGQGLSRAADGSDRLTGGLEQARAGAGEMRAGLDQLQDELGGGFDDLADGLARLDDGLASIADGLHRVEEGLTEVAVGIDRLGEGVDQARAGAAQLSQQIAAPAEDGVRDVWQILTQRFTTGRLDPAYPDALRTVGELHALLTGELPATDDIDELPGDAPQQEELAGLLAQIAELTGEQPPDDDESLGDLDQHGDALEDYPGLTASLDELASGLGEAVDGAEQLGTAVERITAGLTELRRGVQQLRAQLGAATPGAGHEQRRRPGGDAGRPARVRARHGAVRRGRRRVRQWARGTGRGR